MSEVMEFEQGGRAERTCSSFYRGTNTEFHPNDAAFEEPGIIDRLVRGCVPPSPLITKKSNIVAFGSCFADNISTYLHGQGYNVATKTNPVAHIARMGDGIINTFAVLQQFQWAWENKVPWCELWHDYDAKFAGYDEDVRLQTKEVLDRADVFIITLGLSEVWYDEPTGEVFWRAVPKDKFDPKRHKFRTSSYRETYANLHHIRTRIAMHNPSARVIFTLSPIPLTATFRPMSCITANAASKATLRCALDQFIVDAANETWYFPSYELVLNCFNHQFMEDRRHVHAHVIKFVMATFDRYFCGGLDADELLVEFKLAQWKDQKVGTRGHWSVARTNLKYSKESDRDNKLC